MLTKKKGSRAVREGHLSDLHERETQQAAQIKERQRRGEQHVCGPCVVRALRKRRPTMY